MRLLAALVVLVLATHIQAQDSMSTYITGVNPRNLSFQPVNTSRALRAPGNVIRSHQPFQLFNVRNLFRSVNFNIGFFNRPGTNSNPITYYTVPTTGK